jgi:hypothetical protein
VAAVGHFAQIGPGAETAAVGMGAVHVGFAVEMDLRGGVGVRSDEKRRDGEPGAQSGWLEPAENDRGEILISAAEGGGQGLRRAASRCSPGRTQEAWSSLCRQGRRAGRGSCPRASGGRRASGSPRA